jgi:hypothetical protein
MNLLNRDMDMIERMESDLVQKVQSAYQSVPDLHPNVHGVFSLDNLEAMLATDLCQHIGVGIGYLETKPHRPPEQNTNAARGSSGLMALFSYLIILAVPTEEACGTRHNATKLLTLLRAGIQGSFVTDDAANRAWTFVGEKPEISASTKDMLYYSQVWQIALPIAGNP